MGAKYLDRNVKALAVNGRLAIIGMQGGVKAELNIGALLAKRAAISATSLRARPLDEKAAIVAAVREHVWPLIDAGQVRPVVDREIPDERRGRGPPGAGGERPRRQGAAGGAVAAGTPYEPRLSRSGTALGAA